MLANKVYNLNNHVQIFEEQLDFWNDSLQKLASPQEIIKWALITFPNLYQTTAFGLTGLATIDMISKLAESSPNISMVPLLFIDTLHHFPQTLTLLDKVQDRYYTKYNQQIHVFKPQGCQSEKDFSAAYGDFLWETDDIKYDFLAKVEPVSRAYKTLNITAVFTGRRRSQGSSRSDLKFLEIDEINGIIKINPFMNWSFPQVKQYIDDNNVPYNELLDLGYKSIGDYHSTVPVEEGEDERSGRWKGKAKTECGIHETSKFAQYLKDKETAVK
ncbi:hypothetical protein TPHA_0G00330 [Tetrapisispora phaffii CBS 4417]|uniref:phosphoadenylyl-sulfate reductase (thioredoxin) n=1 Tax=Tetrapisispora phaffii (strain ATCC 24235 / CBS 4417 / NBRC 1672 / NRRL Y-8282 / UCD 70-5) TaxID=1071381 RepID=G8BVE3_TETPH|nr:hypothetical protein TPHA_0G00330 [Tetrapisispora phaffii CBS 4417]CCE63871.1 hypothetical protein TPHA_0G00330 [Tetrapisispora phaffii CBS 4417]